METKEMVHYLYKLTFKQDPRYYYYGVHSTVRHPEADGYYGSGGTVAKYKNLFGKDCFNKEILATFSSREELLQEEQKIIADLWKSDPYCLNQTRGGAENGKFDNKGTVIVHNNIQEKFIYPEYLDIFLAEGWEKGRMPRVRDRMKGRYIGYVTLCKEDIVCRVPQKKVNSLVEEGWKVGLPETVLEEKRQRQLGQFIMHSGSLERHIRPEEVQTYEEQGWVRGRSERSIEIMSKARKGMIRMNNGISETLIYKEDLSKYLKDGWVRGYLKGTTDKFGHRGNTHTRGKVGICKDGIDRKVAPEEVEKYLALGWKKGRTHYVIKRNRT